jgi:hypothetical protein
MTQTRGPRFQMTVTFAANGYETRLRNLTLAQVDAIEGSMRLWGEPLSNILRRVQ